MAILVSPGINVSEFDNSTVVPAVSTSVGALAGVFSWGPAYQRVLLDSEVTLTQKFGKPTDSNYETFFTAANFLSYSNALYIVRAIDETALNAAAPIEDAYDQYVANIAYTGTATGYTNNQIVTVSNGTVNATATISTNATGGALTFSVSNTGVFALTKANTDLAISVKYANGSPTNGSGATFGVVLANTASLFSAQQVQNYDDFLTTSVDANTAYLAKYAGTLGNSLKISVCDSPDVYSSVLSSVAAANTVDTYSANIQFVTGSNTATIVAKTTNEGNTAVTGEANDVASSILAKISVGDYIKAGNDSIGFQYLKVTAKSGPIGSETSTYANTANTTTVVANGVTVSFATRYSLASDIDVSSNTVNRYWEYYNAVDKAPGTSTYLSNLGIDAQDEIHVVVVDAGGKFTANPGQVLEVWTNLSRASDAKTPSGASIYYKSVIDEQSNYIYTGTARAGAETGTSATISNATTMTPYTSTFSLGTNGDSESAIALGPVALAYDLYRGKEDVDISLLLQGPAIGTGALSNYIIANIADVRKDCVAFISPDRSIITNSDPAQYCVDFRSSTNNIAGLTYNSSYAFMDTGYKYQYDKYNDVYRWVPLNGDMAGLCCATDYARDAWWSPAGFSRGQVKNVVKLRFNPTQAQRDLLYKNDINPVVNFPGQGTVLYGDKTLLGKPSAFDRINVRRLFIVLEKAISIAARSSLFEFNDSFTRSQFRNLVEPYLRQVQGRRGITDYKVVCDDTNNTQQVIDSNQFVGDIYIKPARSINFIQLNFVAVRSGVDFNTIVGQF